MQLVYNHVKKQSRKRILKRCLTELSQKYTLECTKKMASKFKENNRYFCPCSLHTGDRFFTLNSKGKKVKIILQRAHVGIKRSDIINQVIQTHPDKSICDLLDLVMQKHININIVFACQTCNKKLE